ncbi:MAG TPA: hypothetical protein VNH83_04660, partial [Bryobacteraceae bacterium]|nr:hypothetical protein [Bryobacteraceae bacterium]
MDEKNRVRIPLEIRTVVPWIEQETEQIECVGMPGPFGGIQIEPLTDHRRNVLPFTEVIRNRKTVPSASESGQKWVDVARLLATAWPVIVNIEASRISVTLPEPPRRAQQVPPSGGVVVVFGFGNILEIWD